MSLSSVLNTLGRQQECRKVAAQADWVAVSRWSNTPRFERPAQRVNNHLKSAPLTIRPEVLASRVNTTYRDHCVVVDGEVRFIGDRRECDKYHESVLATAAKAQFQAKRRGLKIPPTPDVELSHVRNFRKVFAVLHNRGY